MTDFTQSNLQNLVKLLNLEDHDSSDDEFNNSVSNVNPTTITDDNNKDSQNFNDKNINEANENRTDKYAKIKTSKNIWEDDEILDEEYDESSIKETPDYELVYQQDVTPDDVFLQLTGKDPGTHSCENMVIKVKLKEIESSKEIALKISETTFLCKTRIQYLNIELPRQIDPEKCSAKWDSEECILNVILAIEKHSEL